MKKALTQADGDFEKAIEILREQGLAAANKKAGRIAAEGMVYAVSFDNCAVVVEVNAETDFVAKNDKFVEFTKNLAKVVADENPADVEALMACKMGEGTVDDALKALILVIKGEHQGSPLCPLRGSLRCLRPWRRHPRCHRQVRDQRRGCC